MGDSTYSETKERTAGEKFTTWFQGMTFENKGVEYLALKQIKNICVAMMAALQEADDIDNAEREASAP